MVTELKEYMVDYKKSLEYMIKRSMLENNFEDQQTIQHIIKQIRHTWFSIYQDYIFRFFYPFERSTYGHLEDCEVFLFDNNQKAIRRFNRYYYIVKVESYYDGILRTESPDDYPLHVIPSKGTEYPEFLMADYLITLGF